MKKILILFVSCVLMLFCVSCGHSKKINVSNPENLLSNSIASFIEIEDFLVYDSGTGIVYIKNYTYLGNYVYTAYYAPNGLPYKYNPEANTLEEITFQQNIE